MSRISSSLMILLILAGCSSGPRAAEKGTPPFYWQAAKETFAAGDYTKTLDHLGQLAKSQNEFRGRALIWSLALTSGLESAYAEMGDNFETGARANTANPAPFRRQASDARSRANQLALNFAETVPKFLAESKDATVKLDFPFPSGTVAAVPQLAKASSGALLSETEIADAQKRALARGVILSVTQFAGAGKDAAKASEMFKRGPVDVPRPAILLAIAEKLHEQAQLYGKRKLDQPDRAKFFCEQALTTLKSAGDAGSKEAKDLEKKIQSTLKG